MNTVINSALLSQTSVDSGSLEQLSRVIHQFPEVGSYLGTVWKGEQSVARFHLRVDPANTLPQTNIDLASMPAGPGVPCATCAPGTAEPQFTVNPKGYVLFHVSSGMGGFAVTVANGITPTATVVFDSRQLQPGDYFVAQMLQPGAYRTTNVLNKQVHTLEVARVTPPAAVAYVPPAPIVLRAEATGFRLATDLQAVAAPQVKIAALQAKVYEIHTPSRIRIELTTPLAPA